MYIRSYLGRTQTNAHLYVGFPDKNVLTDIHVELLAFRRAVDEVVVRRHVIPLDLEGEREGNRLHMYIGRCMYNNICVNDRGHGDRLEFELFLGNRVQGEIFCRWRTLTPVCCALLLLYIQAQPFCCDLATPP